MIIIIFFENMVIDAFLVSLFNVHYLIFLSMVHEYAYFYEYILIRSITFRACFIAVYGRAGSWSFWALRRESDCGPLVKIYAILALF